jgi:hypothetical protein
MNERIKRLLEFTDNRYGDSDVPQFATVIDKELVTIIDSDKYEFLNSVRIAFEGHIYKLENQPVDKDDMFDTSYRHEVKEFGKRITYIDIIIKSFKPTLSQQTNEDSKIDLSFEMQTITKMLLLKELGIIDMLKKRYGFEEKTEFAKLIAIIIAGNTDNREAISDTIRKYLSKLNLPKKINPLYKDTQKKRVNEVFAQFGIKPIK